MAIRSTTELRAPLLSLLDATQGFTPWLARLFERAFSFRIPNLLASHTYVHQHLIQSIVEEVRSKATGNFLGKLFQLTPMSLAIDIGLRNSFLYVSAEPSSPRFYLIERRAKDLEKQSIQLSHFGQLLRSQLGGGRIIRCDKDGVERIVRLTFRIEDDLGVVHFRRLLAQLTGRAANLFVVDELDRIVATLRPPKGPGQLLGERYQPPPQQEKRASAELISIEGSPSAAADKYYETQDALRSFNARVSEVRAKLRQAKSQQLKLRSNIQKDLMTHGDPEKHKRRGDLLLANIGGAVREGNRVRITDFYAENAPTIDVEIDDATTLQDAAAQSFRLYTKSKRAHAELAARLKLAESEISQLEYLESELDQIVVARDEAALSRFAEGRQTKTSRQAKAKSDRQIPGVRRYLSTDGYEILVGRAAKDNDHLTFRIARPHDLWLHAGDYPGSHVVVRNPKRQEIPQRTVIEAAQLAARYSQASADTKVVIHYTERKFLSKPRGAAPGLVRLSSFRSITVEPKESARRL